jgi:hypothetical protein
MFPPETMAASFVPSLDDVILNQSLAVLVS